MALVVETIVTCYRFGFKIQLFSLSRSFFHFDSSSKCGKFSSILRFSFIVCCYDYSLNTDE